MKNKRNFKHIRFWLVKDRIRNYRLMGVFCVAVIAQVWLIIGVLAQDMPIYSIPLVNSFKTPKIINMADYPNATPEIINDILEVVKERDFKDIERLLAIIKCESRFQQYVTAVNIHYQSDGSILTTLDRGIAQFNSYWRPDVSDECSYDISCSINEMISTVNRDGGFQKWTCNNLI